MSECRDCSEHSGHEARIVSLERESTEQWGEIGNVKKIIDGLRDKWTAILTAQILVLLALIGNLLAKAF